MILLQCFIWILNTCFEQKKGIPNICFIKYNNSNSPCNIKNIKITKVGDRFHDNFRIYWFELARSKKFAACNNKYYIICAKYYQDSSKSELLFFITTDGWLFMLIYNRIFMLKYLYWDILLDISPKVHCKLLATSNILSTNI